MSRPIARLAWLAGGLAVVATAVLSAHTMTFKGTVVAVEAKRVQVKTGEEAKGQAPVWFAIDATTKIVRGKRVVPHDQANIAVGEQAFVTVDHQPNVPLKTLEIRLPAW